MRELAIRVARHPTSWFAVVSALLFSPGAVGASDTQYVTFKSLDILKVRLRDSPRRQGDPQLNWLYHKIDGIDRNTFAFVRLSWVQVDVGSEPTTTTSLPAWGIKKIDDRTLTVEMWTGEFPDAPLSFAVAQRHLGVECHVLGLFNAPSLHDARSRYRDLVKTVGFDIEGHPCA